MNPSKQLWALVKFQMTANPFILFMAPLLCFLPIQDRLAQGSRDYEFLDVVLQNFNLYMIGIVALSTLAPDIFRNFGNNAALAGGSTFLLTRAVDRPIVYRSRALLFNGLLLTCPFLLVLSVLSNPDLRVKEVYDIPSQQLLDALPGSWSGPHDRYEKFGVITIPHGNILLQAWHLAFIAVAALAIQILSVAIQRLKYGWIIFTTLFFGSTLLPLFQTQWSMSNKESLSENEWLFIAFANHQVIFWTCLILLFAWTQVWSERRFTQLEQ